MKKVFLILVAIIGLGFSANAQQYRTFYSDSKITAQLRQVGYKTSTSCNGIQPTHLNILNKTNSKIKVTGIIKVEYRLCDGSLVQTTEKQFEIEIDANREGQVNDYFVPTYKSGYYQTLEFWIDTVDGQSMSSSSSYSNSKSSSIPAWLIGTWYNDDFGNLFTVTGSQIQWLGQPYGALADFIKVDGEIVFFQWRNGNGVFRITQLGQGRALYDNPNTGSAYVVKKR